jgi:hypothetical protein
MSPMLCSHPRSKELVSGVLSDTQMTIHSANSSTRRLDAVALAREHTTDAASLKLIDDTLHTGVGTDCEEEETNNDEENIESHADEICDLVVLSTDLLVRASHSQERYPPVDKAKKAIKQRRHDRQDCAALVVELFLSSRGGFHGVL